MIIPPPSHEPTLRELAAEIENIHALLEERDRRYEERNTANKDAVKAAFDASKEAIAEAKRAQDAYNSTHNDLVRKMERQSADMVTRADNDSRHQSLDLRVSDLRAQITALMSAAQGSSKVKDESRANISLAVAAIAVLLGLWTFANRQQQPVLVTTSPLQQTTPVAPLPQK